MNETKENYRIPKTLVKNHYEINLCLSFFYLFLLGCLEGIAISHIWAGPQLWFSTFIIGIHNTVFSVIAHTYTVTLFVIFGFMLYPRFQYNAFHSALILGLSYVVWELIPSLSNIIMGVGGPSLFTLSIWTATIILAYSVVKPRINLNHAGSVMLFLYYVNATEMINGLFGKLTLAQYNLLEAGGIFFWILFVLMTFSPTRSKVNRI